MIHFSFSSVFMTVLMSNVLLIVITFCFRNENLLMNIGYKLMAVFCLVTLVRLLFPFELPITKTLAFPKLLSDIVFAFRYPYGRFLGIWLSPWTGFCVIWFIGVIVQLVNLDKDYKTVRRFARTYGINITEQEPYASILQELCTERQRRHIRVLQTRGIEIPMIIGLRNARILLPENVDVSDADTLYAIKHEIYHYVHHDLWIKLAVNCLVIAYWWNPCSRILKRQTDMLMEMRIDDSVMDKGHEEAVAYVASMHHYAINADRKQREKQDAAPLFNSKGSALHYRLRMMQSHYNKVNYWACISMLLVMVSLYIGSYLFIFEASAYEPDVAEAFATTEDNTYAIQNEDGSYDVYFYGEIFIETVDTLEYYPADIKIYSSEEEYHEKNR